MHTYCTYHNNDGNDAHDIDFECRHFSSGFCLIFEISKKKKVFEMIYHLPKKNKAGYTATKVACGWARAVIKKGV